MNIEPTFISAIVIGLGATLLMDAWALIMRFTFNIPSLNYCMVGRWICLMPGGVFTHSSIAEAPRMKLECTAGWLAHYLIGAIFALMLVVLTSGSWLEKPTFIPALLFGVGTVLVPFLIMQPSFGLGVAAAKTPNPNQARLRSIMAHGVFGIGLYVSALSLNQFLS